MAKYFNQSDIDEFRDCFFLFAKEKIIINPDELCIIMRSLGFSPTIEEIKKYYSQYQKDNRVDFATFLEIMHVHSEKEKCQQEILAGFRSQDVQKTGTVPGPDVVHILTQFGEKLNPAEVERFFKESNSNAKGPVQYEALLRTLLTPLPDY